MNSNSEFIPTGLASKTLGLHPNTLRKYQKKGLIPSIQLPSGHYLYNVNEFILQKSKQSTSYKVESVKVKKNICYCRVSSRQQKDDLERQVQFLSTKYPNHDIIKDIGSGLNYKRPGLQKMVEYAMQGNIGEIVVTHKDRLCRFGFELIEQCVKSSNGKIVVLNETTLSPQEELSKDLLNILHVFSCRMYGLRKYKGEIADKVKESGKS